MKDEKNISGVVFVCDFVCSGKSKFSDYISYIDRGQATKSKTAELLYEMYADVYMDNEDKTSQKKEAGSKKESALFTACSNFLTKVEKKKVKKLFATAQKNGSPLWRNVLSFDTDFLIKNHLLDRRTGLFDELKIKNITRCAIDKLLRNEKMEHSAIWVGAVHYNTDNIHIHIALAEPQPTRKKVVYKGKEEYRGKYKSSTIKSVKSVVINEIISRDKELEQINYLIRNVIVGEFRKVNFRKEKVLRKKIKALRKALPKSRTLWRYNMNAMQEVRPFIDDMTDTYIELYHKQEYEQLLKALAKQERVNCLLYGSKSRGQYTKTKLDELHTKMGNTILSYLKSQALVREKISSVKTWHRDYKLICNLRKALKKDFNSIKNLNEFNMLENEISNRVSKHLGSEPSLER